MYYLYIEPDAVFGMNEISLEFVLICLIGGMGLAFGPVLGAAILIPLSNILRAQFSAVSGLHGFLYGLIMLLVVLARPDGLLSLIGGNLPKVPCKVHTGRSYRPREGGGTSMLMEVRNVTKRFGGLAALSGVSFDLEEGRFSVSLAPMEPARPRCSTPFAALAPPQKEKSSIKGST